MDANVSDPSPRVARPVASRSPVGLNLQRLARGLPRMRAVLRMLALVLALCAVGTLVSGSTQAGTGQLVGATRAPLPIILLPGHEGAALSISIQCPKDITANASTGNCSASVRWDPATATVGGACKLQGIAYAIGTTQITSPHTFPVGTTTVTAAAADTCDNVDTCTFRVIVVDNQPPSITCPANGSVNADSSHCDATVYWPAASATDNCSVASLKYYIGSTEITAPHVFPVGTTTITAQARDPSGNAASCNFQLTVRDVTPPAITCPGNISKDSSAGLCSAVATYVVTASDACGVTLTCTPASGSTFPVGTTNVTCQARDPSNNTASCTFQVAVRDALPPVVACPASISQDASAGLCSAPVSYVATATDNCAVTLTCTPPSGSIFAVGATNALCVAIDASGNRASCITQVTVRDTQPPTISCPADLTVNAASGRCTAGVALAATAGDNCTLASLKYYAGTTQISSPYDFPTGTTTVRAEAMDASANTASCTFHVTVRDPVPPTIVCPADMVVSADSGRCSAGVSFAATAGDNCLLSSLHYFLGVTSTTPINSPYEFPLGTSSVRAEARDASDNVASCAFHVTVRDTQPPNISCPTERVVQTDAGHCSASVSLGASATDNCGVDSLRYFWGTTEIGSPHTFSLGTSTVRAEARDAAGNVATCTFPVIVRDGQPPSVSCPSDQTVNTDAGRCSATVPFTATATDNCGVAWLKYYTGTTEIRSPYTFTLGTATVRAVASDTDGNTGECSFHVTVRDNQGPSITCPATVRTNPDPGQSYASHVAVGTATATDPCSVPTVSAARGDGQGLAGPYPVGRTVITWTARDGAGNSSSCTQDVWVGTGPPALYLPCLLKL
jgi:hypothetical protein